MVWGGGGIIYGKYVNGRSSIAIEIAKKRWKDAEIVNKLIREINYNTVVGISKFFGFSDQKEKMDLGVEGVTVPETRILQCHVFFFFFFFPIFFQVLPPGASPTAWRSLTPRSSLDGAVGRRSVGGKQRPLVAMQLGETQDILSRLSIDTDRRFFGGVAGVKPTATRKFLSRGCSFCLFCLARRGLVLAAVSYCTYI